MLRPEDRLDERIGDWVFTTGSTVQLRGVDSVFRLARRAGFVKVRRAGWIHPYRKELVDGQNPDLLAHLRLSAVEVTDVETVTTMHGHEQEHGGRMALTPLGAARVRQLKGR